MDKVHTRTRRKGEEERTNVCDGESRHMRRKGREEGQMLVVERVHAKRSWEGEGEEETFVVESRHMRGEERTNVCGADGAFKND